jgi:hypothetical protein
MMAHVVDLSGLARSVELFIIVKQVMADKLSGENLYNVLSEGN